MLVAGFLLVGVAVTAPLIASGDPLILLDWAVGGPYSFWREMAGVGGGLATGAPWHVVVHGLSRLLGARVTSWLPLLAFFPLSAWAMSRLLREADGWGRLAGSAMYAVNPVVLDRAWVGHYGLMVGYALLPLAVAACVSLAGTRPSAARAALWLFVLTALSPHFAWIGLVLLLAAVGPVLRRAWLPAIRTVLAFALTLAFLAPTVGNPGRHDVTARDLKIYRTTADERFGLMINVAGLHGFWREEPQHGKHVLGGWPFLAAALATVSAVGLLRGHAPARLRRTVALAGVMGFFLALGAQGPTGAIFRWCFQTVPGFAVMREPQKFSVLLALAYAVGFGLGVQRLRRLGGGRLVAGLAVVIPFVYTPTLLFGFGGQLSGTRLPESWSRAGEVAGPGAGKVLVLPWHRYVAFPFTDGRVVFNPAPMAFAREAIVADNVEARGVRTTSTSPRSSYLEFLYESGDQLTTFGRLVAPLGIEYVFVEKTVDFRQYSWLGGQSDLDLVVDDRHVSLYRNAAYRPGGVAAGSVVELRDWGQVVATAEAQGLSGVAVTVGRRAAGPLEPRPIDEPPVPPERRGRPARQTGPTTYRVTASPPALVLPEVYHPSWRSSSGRTFETASGALGIIGASDGDRVSFTRARVAAIGSLVTGLTVAGLASASYARHRLVWTFGRGVQLSRRRRAPEGESL